MTIVKNMDGFEGIAQGIGPAKIWCEIHAADCIHVRMDDEAVLWMRAMGADYTYVCLEAEEAKQGV